MMPITPELLDKLLKDYQSPDDMFGNDGLLQQLTKAVVERALQGEMTHHLSYEEQPLCISVTVKQGRPHTYTPDVLIHYHANAATGTPPPLLAEVKFREDLFKNISNRKGTFVRAAMERYIRLIFAVILLSFPVAAFASPEMIAKEMVLSAGKKRSYYLFVPSTVKASSPAPLIVMLHGSGRSGLSLVEKWKDLASKEGIIIAGPDAQYSQGWAMPGDGPGFIHDLVESLKSKHPINSRRVYLFGHSAGAIFAITMSMLESEYFAATAIHAGAYREPQEYKSISYAKRRIPLAIFAGDKDQFFPLKAVRATRDALQAQGISVELTEMPGHDHWYYDLAPKINRNAWDFLKKYELETEQRYTQYGDSGDTGDANKALTEINRLRNSVNELANQWNAKEAELRRKDFVRERDQINKIAGEEIEILKQSANALRAAAAQAEQVAKMNIEERFKRHLALLIQSDRKSAEAFDVLREQSEAFLSNEPLTTINAKRSEARQRAERLQKEADELQKQAIAIMQ